MPEFMPDYAMVRASLNQDPRITQPQGENPGLRLPDVPLLGAGGQGWVFYVEAADGTSRALKVHKAADDMSSEEARISAQAFEREGEWLKAFDHPNIIKVFETGIHQRVTAQGEGDSRILHGKDYRYMVMEYADQGSAADRVARIRQRYGSMGKLPVEDAVLCILHASEGMRYAHQESGISPPNLVHGLTHGDLNPRNLVIVGLGNRPGLVKVADFGIARHAHSSVETMTSTQMHAFSLQYASPDQIEHGRVLVRDDVYSLGITAYELLTGERPIQAEYNSAPSFARAHREQQVAPMERMRNGKIDWRVEELNEAILPAIDRNLDGSTTDTSHELPMGEFQEAVKEALAKGNAKAAQDKTIILMPGRTEPLTADQLLYSAGLDQEAGVHVAETRVVTAAPPPILHKDTEGVGEVPRSTHLLKNPSGFLSRRKLLFGGSAVIAGLAGGVWWANTAGNNPEREEQEELEQERTAIAALADKVMDLLSKEGSGDEVVEKILPQYIAYSPQKAAPRIEELVRAGNYDTASWLAARLVDYDPARAQKIMQAFLDRGAYDQAVTVAMRLATYAQTPARVEGTWQDEAERVRSIVAGVPEASSAKLQTYEQLFRVALFVGDYIASAVLPPEFRDSHDPWAIRSLAVALGPHNPNAIANAVVDWRNRAEETEPINYSYAARDAIYAVAEALCKVITPYAPDRVAELAKSINDIAIKPRLAAGLAAYRPQAAIQYLKEDQGENASDPMKWSFNQYEQTTALALGHAEPSLMATLRKNFSSDKAYAAWLDAAIDPSNPAFIDTVYDMVVRDKTQRSVYAADFVNALLQSRMPKLQ